MQEYVFNLFYYIVSDNYFSDFISINTSILYETPEKFQEETMRKTFPDKLFPLK